MPLAAAACCCRLPLPLAAAACRCRLPLRLPLAEGREFERVPGRWRPREAMAVRLARYAAGALQTADVECGRDRSFPAEVR